jgi:hypothetical protein
MDKWEYYKYSPDGDELTDNGNTKMSETLEELGEQGWELAAPLNSRGNTTTLVLKRKKMSGSSQERESEIER